MAACSETAKPLLAELGEAALACEDAHVAVNPHTPHTVNGLRGSLEALERVLKRADEALTAQVVNDQAGAATPEQLKEIREVFDYFDEDHDDSLDLQELIEGCKGAGFDLEDDEVERKLKALNCARDAEGELRCDFEQFATFMLAELQTGDGAQAVRGAFQQLSGSSDGSIAKAAVERNFGSCDAGLATYLHAHMPGKEGGGEQYDFVRFTKTLFEV
jgi:hypothetical protein